MSSLAVGSAAASKASVSWSTVAAGLWKNAAAASRGAVRVFTAAPRASAREERRVSERILGNSMLGVCATALRGAAAN